MIAPIHTLRVVGIGGSLRANSVSYRALDVVLGHVARLGCQTSCLDLRDTPLPLCNGDKSEAWPDFPGVAMLREQVRSADALVLATPEYHGSFSGVMKNVLDLLDFEHLEGKSIAAISVLGGRHNSNALNHLRTVVRWCHASMIPEQVIIENSRTAFDAYGRLRPDVSDRCESLALALIRHTAALAATRDLLAPLESSARLQRGR